MDFQKYKILSHIDSPKDLKGLPDKCIPALAEEIRRFLVENVTKTGGHLASNLGVVELTLALHKVFDSPKDRIVFDVGHQSYVHKLLTGRKAMFDTLRQPGGLSGFTKRSESEHDPFGAGHSTTAFSAALGFAMADQAMGRTNKTIAVIGDGAFTGGMAYEALNNCRKDLNLIIILNENEMSISRNIGSFAKHMAKIRTSRRYFESKRITGNLLNSIPLVGDKLYDAALSAKRTLKNTMYHSNIFEEMGLYYCGPADGNDYEKVVELLQEASQRKESVIIHLRTKKGKGYEPAENNPGKYHGIPANFQENNPPATNNFSMAFGRALCALAQNNPRVCAITAAMRDGTGLLDFSCRYPKRFYDVGIAEEHALTFAAGLACAGMRPFFAVYSSFLQRGYDNIIHDIALQKLPVTVMIDRAGWSKGDGVTHHGIFDVAFLSHIPNVTLYAPFTYQSLSEIMRETLTKEEPVFIRYANCAEDTKTAQCFTRKSECNRWVRCNFSAEEEIDSYIITYGKMASEAFKTANEQKGKRVGVILLEMLKPYDSIAMAVEELIGDGEKEVLFMEEGVRAGGAGMMLGDALHRRSVKYHYEISAIEESQVFL